MVTVVVADKANALWVRIHCTKVGTRGIDTSLSKTVVVARCAFVDIATTASVTRVDNIDGFFIVINDVLGVAIAVVTVGAYALVSLFKIRIGETYC